MRKNTMTMGLCAWIAVMTLANPAGAGDADYGKSLASQCTSCHGPEGEGMGQNPPIAGMPEDEFIRRLSAFKSGERQSMMMGIMAKKLSDSDIADLAAYFAEQ